MNRSRIIDLLLVILAFLSIGLLMYELDHPEVIGLTTSIDFCIAIVFLSEYASSTYRATKRFEYAIGHWYDLLASIPVPFSVIRMFRTIRLVRMIRLMRLLRVSRAFGFLERSKMGYIAVAFLMVTLFGAISFHILEFGENPAIQNSLDGLYWALATITTVGFGDIVPITLGGKIITIGLMIAGIAIYASLAGLLASYLVGTRVNDSKNLPPELEKRLKRIERNLNNISLKLEETCSKKKSPAKKR